MVVFFFLVRSGAVDWQRQKACAVLFWSILRLVLSNDNNQVVFFMVRSFIYPSVYSCREWKSEWGQDTGQGCSKACPSNAGHLC
jgi:hypothetical protein